MSISLDEKEAIIWVYRKKNILIYIVKGSLCLVENRQQMGKGKKRRIITRLLKEIKVLEIW